MSLGFGRRTLHLSLALSSVVGAIGRADLRKEVGLFRPGLGHVARRRFGTEWCSYVPGHGVLEMVTLLYKMRCDAMQCNAMLCYAMLSNATLSYATLRYVA